LQHATSLSLLTFLMISLFVLSLAVLLFEITLTRIFSIILWYDYAFMAISVAFFGLGIGALVVHIVKYKISKSKESVVSKVLQCSVAFAVSIPIFLFLIGYVIPSNTSFIYLFYLVSSIPFFFGGMSMALVYLAMPKEISKLYFVDLVGAAAATLILDPLMQWLGAESVVILISLLIIVPIFTAALVLFYSGSKKLELTDKVRNIIIIKSKPNFFGIISLVVLSVLLIANTITSNELLKIHPGENKGLRHQTTGSSTQHLSTQWNSFSRVDVIQNIKNPRILASIIIDADALTPVFRWNSTSAEDTRWIKQYMDFMPFEMSQVNSTLVIGGGGGEDVLIALTGGSKNVTVVEINPLIISASKKFGGNSAGNLYERKDVKLFIDDGRRFISSDDTKYDRIILKLVDSWAAQLAGGYALSENYLYTVEAFQQYLQHLEEDGILVMVRWNTELPRLIPLVIESFKKEHPEKSIQDLSKQLVVVEDRPGLFFGSNEQRTVYAVLIMMKNKPFTESEINLIKNRIDRSDAKVIAVPGELQSPYDRLFLAAGNIQEQSKDKQLQEINDNFLNSNPTMSMKPPTDNSPFYFAKEPIPKQMLTLLETVLGVSAVLAILLIYYSRLTRGRNEGSVTSLYPSPFHIIFVICIGLGFMFLEITFIQKFLLLLGTPIMALTVILFSFLLSSGIGAYLSGRLFSKNPYKAIVVSIPILSGILLLYFGYLQTIIDSSITLDIQKRIALTFGLLFPIGLLMGFQFPSITKLVSSYKHSSLAEKNNESTSQYDVTLLWGVNIIASVVGTVLTVISSMIIGFSGNLIIGICLYLTALTSAIAIANQKVKTDSRSIVR
jgi:Spermine/spermidine synthase domain